MTKIFASSVLGATLALLGGSYGPCDKLLGGAKGEATPSASVALAPPPPLPPIETAQNAPANFSCEVTKRSHSCQAAEGSMLSCTATSKIPWEKKIVNNVFNTLSGTKAAVDACGKVPGALAGSYVVSGIVDDPQIGPRMNMKAKKGSGPTADCLAKALSFQLPKAPRGDDDPPGPLTLNYALDVAIECK
jgi:hypothetical protein